MILRIAALNVAHQMDAVEISDELAPALKTLNPDVIVLTEFVPAETTPSGRVKRPRQPFYGALRDAGLHPPLMSDIVEGGYQNHVLISSRLDLVRGSLSPPDTLPHAANNFLHVQDRNSDMEIVGIRIPFAETPNGLRDYWEWFAEFADNAHQRKMIIIGDLNVDPDRPERMKRPYLDRMRKHWAIPRPVPEDGWSFWRKRTRSRIDHALVSHRLAATEAKYVAESERFCFAGDKPNALSDHAVLLIDVTEVPSVSAE